MGNSDIKDENRNKKVWSKIDKIPKKKASDNITKGCLVLEGGAFRGVFTNAVVDYLMYQDLNFESVIGVSAGALNGLNYVAGQIGRGGRVNLTYRHNPSYVGLKAIKESKGVYGFDFVFNDFNEIEPLDMERVNSGRQRFVAVATALKDGKPAYFELGKTPDIFQAVRASASMPFVSKPVIVEGEKYLDGGSGDKIPCQWAIDEGYDKIVAVSTRPKGFRKDESEKNADRIRRFYHKYPEFAEGLIHVNHFENEQRAYMEKLHDEGRIYVIYPTDFINDVGRLEGDMEKLGHLYYVGYEETKKHMDELRAYLNR